MQFVDGHIGAARGPARHTMARLFEGFIGWRCGNEPEAGGGIEHSGTALDHHLLG